MKHYLTSEVATCLNVSKDTLLKWIRDGKISDSTFRDGHGWRIWTQDDVDKIKQNALTDRQRARLDSTNK